MSRMFAAAEVRLKVAAAMILALFPVSAPAPRIAWRQAAGTASRERL